MSNQQATCRATLEEELIALKSHHRDLQRQFDALFESQDGLREINAATAKQLESARRANNDLRETVERLSRERERRVVGKTYTRPAFSIDLTEFGGRPLSALWSTSDGRVFLAMEEAGKHQATLDCPPELELAPCPLCGYAAWEINRKPKNYQIACRRSNDDFVKNLHTPEPVCYLTTGSYPTAKEARAVWNKRWTDD